jgi:hypothetical protein
MIQLINATPHDINLILEDGTKITYPKIGLVPRITQTYTDYPFLYVDGVNIPVKLSSLSELVGLPTEKEDIYYIVSLLVLEEGKKIGRRDLLAPDTLRDGAGNIIGCKGFIK